LGFSDEEANKITHNLASDGLITSSGGLIKISITQKGVSKIHENDNYQDLESKSVSNVNITVRESKNVNINSPNSSQENIEIINVYYSELKNEMDLIRNELKKYKISNENLKNINDMLKTIEDQLSQDKPNGSLIKNAGQSLKNILISALGAAAGQALVTQFPNLFGG